MRVVFLLNRSNTFVYYAPTIEYLVRKRVKVELLTYKDEDYETKTKNYLKPGNLKSKLLKFIKIKKFDNYKNVQQYLEREIKTINQIFSIYFLSDKENYLSSFKLDEILSKWSVISNDWDSFIQIRYKKKLLFNKDTKFFLSSKYIYRKGLKYLKLCKNNLLVKFKKAYYVGNSFYSKKIFIKKKLVYKNLVYIPFPYSKERFLDKKDFSFQAAYSGKDISFVKFYNEFIKNKNINKIGIYKRHLKHKISCYIEILKKYNAVKKYKNTYNETNVILAVRDFCNKNNLKFICKPRLKFPFNESLFKYADQIIYDDQSTVYPTKLQDLLSKSDIVVGGLSYTLFETVMFGVPYINIEMPKISFPKNPEEAYWYDYSLYSYFNYPGVVFNYNIENFIKSFGISDINQYRCEQKKRKKFLNKYCGIDNNKTLIGKKIYQILLNNKN